MCSPRYFWGGGGDAHFILSLLHTCVIVCSYNDVHEKSLKTLVSQLAFNNGKKKKDKFVEFISPNKGLFLEKHVVNHKI